MTPSVERLSALLQGFDCAMLTVIDAAGHPRTRPMIPLRAPFNGHVWLRLGADGQPIADIGRGAEVSVAYGTGAAGPFVTVYGWAIVLRDPPDVRSFGRATGKRRHLRPQSAPKLVCVSARAAEVWDAASTTSPRVFAFSNTRPAWQGEGPRLQEPALTPRVALRLATCASWAQ